MVSRRRANSRARTCSRGGISRQGVTTAHLQTADTDSKRNICMDRTVCCSQASLLGAVAASSGPPQSDLPVLQAGRRGASHLTAVPQTTVALSRGVTYIRRCVTPSDSRSISRAERPPDAWTPSQPTAAVAPPPKQHRVWHPQSSRASHVGHRRITSTFIPAFACFSRNDRCRQHGPLIRHPRRERGTRHSQQEQTPETATAVAYDRDSRALHHRAGRDDYSASPPLTQGSRSRGSRQQAVSLSGYTPPLRDSHHWQICGLPRVACSIGISLVDRASRNHLGERSPCTGLSVHGPNEGCYSPPRHSLRAR